MENVISLAEAARRAGRSKACVRRWIEEGWLGGQTKQLPGRNGIWLIDGDEFDARLPHILETMESRKGGHGKKEPDAFGNDRD
jgi:hypothetical protein